MSSKKQNIRMLKHNLYIIKFKDFDYEQYDSFLVSADNKKECEEIVINVHGRSSSVVNWNGDFIISKIGGTNKKKSILMGSFNAG